MSLLEHWVWLGMAFGSADARTDEIIHSGEDIAQIFSQDFPVKFTSKETARLHSIKLDDAKRIVENMEKSGITILTPDDERYPNRLRNIFAQPVVLYVDGELGDIDNELAIAMVGTRECSNYGYTVANKIGTELASAGAVIISGLAKGIDTVCHTAAVKCGRRTIAVLGCGVDATYPLQNKTLRELIAKNGAVISEFAPGTPPAGRNFPVRNHIISGLSMGVVVVEAGEYSGSLITANVALEQGKDVFAVPNDIFNTEAQGTFKLLRQGAIPVSCGMDILEEYRFRFENKIDLQSLEAVNVPTAKPAKYAKEAAPVILPPVKVKKPTPVPEGLSKQAAIVCALLGEIPMQIEEIAEKLQIPIKEVLTALTELEIIGEVSAHSGKRYRRVDG